MAEGKNGSARRRIGLGIYAVIAAGATVTAVAFSIQSASAGSDLRSNLTYIAPAGVGGGWDGFAREQQQAMRAAGIVNNVQVVNIPGAGGTIGLSNFATQAERPDNLLATGAAMVGGIEMNDSRADFSDTRPIARVAEDYAVVVVPADAPYQSINDLGDAWAEDPSSVIYTGGSAGSIDHLIIAAFALENQVDPAEITYVPKSGGGEAIQTLMADTADVAVTGYIEVADQIETGRVRPLAIAAPERLDGVDVPTFAESGYAVELVNWRGVLAAPGISDQEFDELTAIITETRDSPEWREALERNRWVDSFLVGEEFERFLIEDQAQTAELVESLGL